MSHNIYLHETNEVKSNETTGALLFIITGVFRSNSINCLKGFRIPFFFIQSSIFVIY